MHIGMTEAPGLARWKITDSGSRRMLCYRPSCPAILQEYFHPTGDERKVYAKRIGKEGHYKGQICGFVSVSDARWSEALNTPTEGERPA